MSWVLLSILCSAVIYLIFKLFATYRVDTLVAIVSNYAMACGLGMALALPSLERQTLSGDWLWLLPILGFLFISLFQLMARVAQEAGVGVAALANKMSLIVPVTVAFVFFGEGITLFKVIGIGAALWSVWMVTTSEKGQGQHKIWPVWVLFVGSGILDTLLKWSELKWVPEDHLGLFTASIFGSAGLLGMVWVLVKKGTWNFRSILAGLILGIPNYGSIYFLLKALGSPNWESSILFPINNVAVVLLSSLLGIFLFSESSSSRKWLGLALGVLAVIVLAYA